MKKKVFLVFTEEPVKRVLLCRCTEQLQSLVYGRLVFGSNCIILSSQLPEGCPTHGYLYLDLSPELVNYLLDNDYVEITKLYGDKVDKIMQSILQDDCEE